MSWLAVCDENSTHRTINSHGISTSQPGGVISQQNSEKAQWISDWHFKQSPLLRSSLLEPNFGRVVSGTNRTAWYLIALFPGTRRMGRFIICMPSNFFFKHPYLCFLTSWCQFHKKFLFSWTMKIPIINLNLLTASICSVGIYKRGFSEYLGTSQICTPKSINRIIN